MNAPEYLPLPDLQNTLDGRELAIDRVGVKGVRFPITVAAGDGTVQACVARFDLYVALSKHLKGTHMSRFLEMLEAIDHPISIASGAALLDDMLTRLAAPAGRIGVTFAYFVRKRAPVSGVTSLLDYDVSFAFDSRPQGGCKRTLQVVVPVTSLCPCSKEIANYGAHNQRSHLTLTLEVVDISLTLEEVIRLAERQASCEVYGLLKRPDEKYVTERAYDNPQFAEDLVRDVARALIADVRVGDFIVEAENFESIHNHSAYARIEHTR